MTARTALLCVQCRYSIMQCGMLQRYSGVTLGWSSYVNSVRLYNRIVFSVVLRESFKKGKTMILKFSSVPCNRDLKGFPTKSVSHSCFPFFLKKTTTHCSGGCMCVCVVYKVAASST